MGVWDFAFIVSASDLPVRSVDDFAAMLAPYRGICQCLVTLSRSQRWTALIACLFCFYQLHILGTMYAAILDYISILRPVVKIAQARLLLFGSARRVNIICFRCDNSLWFLSGFSFIRMNKIIDTNEDLAINIVW